LLDKIRTTVPGLSLEIEVALSPLPVSVKANTTLLNRTILEVLRAIAQKAKGRPNKTVVKLSVIETMETVSVQMTDNIFGFTDPTKPRDISCSENVRRIAEAAVRPYGGSAAVYSTDSGSAVELVFPLRADSWQIDLNPRLYSPLAYVAYRERGLSDTMVYLGDLTD